MKFDLEISSGNANFTWSENDWYVYDNPNHDTTWDEFVNIVMKNTLLDFLFNHSVCKIIIYVNASDLDSKEFTTLAKMINDNFSQDVLVNWYVFS